MLRYLENEWRSYGGDLHSESGVGAVKAASKIKNRKRDIDNKAEIDKEKPIFDGNRYCYNKSQKIKEYEQELKPFTLGQSETRVSSEQFYVYSGRVLENTKYFAVDPPCGTKIRLHFDEKGDVSISGESFEPIYIEVAGVSKRDDGQYEVTVYRDRNLPISNAQGNVICRGMSHGGIFGIQGTGQLQLSSSIIPEITYGYQMKVVTTTNDMFVWGECIQTKESTRNLISSERKEKQNKISPESRVIINEQVDGFWKVITETISIELQGYFKPYATMGGAFKNWLVDSGFEKYEHKYSYERDGQVVNAITVTYPNPTGEAGMDKSWRPQTDYNGPYKVLQPGDQFSIWYTEDKWQIANAIYAKNFQSDSMAEGKLENNGDLIFRMNYISGLDKIANKKGWVKYRYVNGGFAQVDTSTYTGMAIILNFQCTGEKFRTIGNNVRLNNRESEVAYVGDIYTDTSRLFYRENCCAGYAAGYNDDIIKHRMTISYTALKPSDPEFVTGGDAYEESITTPLYNKIRDLQDQINSIRAEINIGQVTSAVFEAITNLGNLPNLFANVVPVFTELKTALNVLRGKKGRKHNAINATTMIDKNNKHFPEVTIKNKMPEEVELGIVYNSIRGKKYIERNQHEFAKFALSTEIELPYISRAETLTKATRQKLIDKGILTDDVRVVQIDPMDTTISVLRGKHADLAKYKLDRELVDEVLSEMSSNSTRSIFSLNVRKQIFEKNEFSLPTYGDLVDRILDDGQLLDIFGRLNRSTAEQLLDEMLDRINDMLTRFH
uniref:Outer capsid spike protein VP4 n=1 Tax=Rotavirus G TaxID=183407 RepID=A0A024CEF6_9REOV|nr:outer capsid spike protein VP4 [Rotavirus G]